MAETGEKRTGGTLGKVRRVMKTENEVTKGGEQEKSVDAGKKL